MICSQICWTKKLVFCQKKYQRWNLIYTLVEKILKLTSQSIKGKSHHLYRKFVMNKHGKVIFDYWSGDSISRSYFENIVLIDKHPVIWIFSQNIFFPIQAEHNLQQESLATACTSAIFLLFNEYLEVLISFKYT